MVKNLPANSGDLRDMGAIPRWGRSHGVENSNPFLAWKNPMDRGVWRATVHGVTRSQTRLSIHAHRSLKIIFDHRSPCDFGI